MSDILTAMIADALLPHPSGECRCVFPGSIMACRLDTLHDDDHDAGPVTLTDGEQSIPLRWPQSRPGGGGGDE